MDDLPKESVIAPLRRRECTPHFLFALAEKKTGRARSKRKERFAVRDFGRSPERRIPRRGLRGNGRSGMPRSPFFAAAPWVLRGSGSGTRRDGSPEPPNSRLYHGAGRDLPGIRLVVPPRNIFSFPPCTAHFLFDVSKRKWGVHSTGKAGIPSAEAARPSRWEREPGRNH